ncbi:sialate O-acetylesterase [Levilactobacillus acidifarinae]|uniref:Sialate O-acetylesterase domain-containing protein n=1 Tax=Levilactobacillus acidifarinae DSM 19394 = JCM 15949 TaxID=1423715 RepID=A0A0R1LPX4_9LACO|nr:sialate O-acetylesterase [Levilactobacillus acidifarinae]KRK94266.1 hypothetical protein FD25_GL000222 [Levilactobacillus acidifarinae DSM 19394]GEO69910.1 acetylxylan esterase [Levilactobacillus acidifarinae]
MQSILMVGQSNMAGRGFLTAVPPILNDHLRMLRNGRWQQLAEPVNVDREVAGVGPAPAFAQAWSADHPADTLGLIPCAEGGSALADWAPDAPLMRHAISEARFAQETSEIVAILWHQGESDSLNLHYRTYRDQLRQTLTHLRTALNLPTVPLILGGLPAFLGQHGFGLSATEAPQIDALIHQTASDLPHTYFVTAADLTANPDGIHLDAPSQRRFGVRYYQAFRQRADVLAPLPDEPQRVAQLTAHPLTPAETLYLQSKRFALGQTTFTEFMAAVRASQTQGADA